MSTNELADARFNAISEISPDGILTANFFGIITYVNPAFSTLTGYAYDEFVGKHFVSIPTMKQKDLKPLLGIFKNIITGKTSTTAIQFPFHRKDGSSGVGDAYVSTLKVKNKRELITIIKDVTEKVEMEKEREQYTENLETLVEERTNQILDNEKMVTLAKVSSMIAHDLKGPLQVIKNALYLIKLKPNDSNKYLGFIEKAVNQANDLLDEFRNRGKISPLKLESVDLGKLVEESLLQVKTSEKIHFKTVINTSNNPMLDRSKILRVLNNLIKNAVEAMPDGGTLKIYAETVANQTILKIIDTGSGIPEGKLGNLFRPFQSSKDKGLGLGLPFCKDTVEQHGGNISVSSILDKGTTITLSFPEHPENEMIPSLDQIKTPEA